MSFSPPPMPRSRPPAVPLERAFVLAPALAARLAAACAARGDDARDVIADLIVEFCDEVEAERDAGDTGRAARRGPQLF